MAALQAKVYYLGILLVVFTLVAVPLFHQVRKDVNEERYTAKNTPVMKFIRDLGRDMNPPDDLEVEDAQFQEWQEKNPECGAKCDPNGDIDGDNKTNKQEIDEGTNPACNEREKGKEYCQGQSTDPPPPDPDNPGNVTEIAVTDTILSVDNGQADSEHPFDSPMPIRYSDDTPNPYYHRWLISWQLSNYRGIFSYTVYIVDANETIVFEEVRNMGVGSSTDSFQDEVDAVAEGLVNGQYRLRIDTQDPASGPTVQGDWDITIRATRDGTDK